MEKEEFIEKANVVHNYFYNYDKVNYKNNKTKIIISCPNHGDIEVRPDNHLRGIKCKYCSNNNIKYTIDDFIIRSNKIHNNKYKYDKVDYVDTHTKIKIICVEHGIFEQKPYKHLNGQGCVKCSKNCKKDFDYYLVKFNKLYDNKYSYDNIFINLRTKINICCKEHGWFKKKILDHLYGQGCPYCNYKTNQQDFINMSNIIHNNKYDYSLVEYSNNKIKIKIICPNHGVFETSPRQHLIGQECKLCSNKNMRLKMIKRIEENKNNGYQIFPNYNKNACKLFDEISLKENIHIQHAMNGGEYYIKELGYWIDGYDQINNVVYEFDENYHKYQKEKDLIRQQEIENFLNTKIIRIYE